jgi:hypothetical protein
VTFLVLPVKLFDIRANVDLNLLVRKLKDFREEDPYQISEDENVTLVTEILDLELKQASIAGTFSKDFIRSRYYRRELMNTVVTEEAPFWIKSVEKRTFLIVSAPSVARGVKKLLTGHVANKLSEVFYITRGTIVEVRMSHDTLRELHESNSQATKLIWFDDVDIPNVQKLCLAGVGLADTKLYHDYLSHGKIWYVVFKVQKRGIVVGITRNAVITLFSKSTITDFINYILEDVLKLLE